MSLRERLSAVLEGKSFETLKEIIETIDGVDGIDFHYVDKVSIVRFKDNTYLFNILVTPKDNADKECIVTVRDIDKKITQVDDIEFTRERSLVLKRFNESLDTTDNYIIADSMKEMYDEYLSNNDDFSFDEKKDEILMIKDNRDEDYYRLYGYILPICDNPMINVRI